MILTGHQVGDLLTTHGIRPSRALGQNFVTDPNTVRRVARLAEIGPESRVLEIGPGVGSLTLALLETGADVTAVEIDAHLIPVLEAVVGSDKARIINADAMTVDWSTVLGDFDRWVLVANLPYNLATPLIADLLDKVPAINRMLVMVQKEVAERLAAKAGDEAYGAVSVKVAYWAEATMVGRVPPTVFIPRPNVESALVAIKRRPSPAIDPEIVDADALFAVVRAGFGKRRKMLRRSLAGVIDPAAFEAAGVDPEARAETLDVYAWGRLTAAAALARGGSGGGGAGEVAVIEAPAEEPVAEEEPEAPVAEESVAEEEPGPPEEDPVPLDEPDAPGLPDAVGVVEPVRRRGRRRRRKSSVPVEAEPTEAPEPTEAAEPTEPEPADEVEPVDEAEPADEVEPAELPEPAEPEPEAAAPEAKRRRGLFRRHTDEQAPIVIDAPAKLTLSLKITGVRSDGYHLIDAEMVTLDLCDTLEFTKGKGLEIIAAGAGTSDIPSDGSNLVNKALKAVGRKSHVKLHKRIPTGAGLGGGSADAAAVLRWAGVDDLNRAASIGSDVPFCLYGGRARVTGTGEEVEALPIADLAGKEFTLLTPPLHVSSKDVYAAWDRLGGPVGEGLNDLEPAALEVEPRLAEYRDELAKATGQTPVLAGSGGTWFVEGAWPGDGRVVVRVAGILEPPDPEPEPPDPEPDPEPPDPEPEPDPASD